MPIACEQKGCSGCITFGKADQHLSLLATSDIPMSVGEEVHLKQKSESSLRATCWLLAIPTFLLVSIVGVAEWASLHQTILLPVATLVLGLYFLLLKTYSVRFINHHIHEVQP